MDGTNIAIAIDALGEIIQKLRVDNFVLQEENKRLREELAKKEEEKGGADNA